jgi:hypothetical protein
VLFDLLLDIAASDFTPQQLGISGGPGIQLELQQVLEEIQKNTAASAVAPSSSNRVWSLPNRLMMLQRREE